VFSRWRAQRTGKSALPEGRSTSISLGAFGVGVGDDYAEPPLILGRGDEGADQAAIVVGVAVVQHADPEVVSGLVRVAQQVELSTPVMSRLESTWEIARSPTHNLKVEL
jgi:hypothetical protein